MRSRQAQEVSAMTILQIKYVQTAVNGFWQSMARTAKCWFVRIGNVDTERLFPEQQLLGGPKCHKKMEMIMKGKEETFVCVCGYKERLLPFRQKSKGRGRSQQKRRAEIYETAAKRSKGAGKQ